MRPLVFVASMLLCGLLCVNAQAQNAAQTASRAACKAAGDEAEGEKVLASARWTYAGGVNDSALSDRAWAVAAPQNATAAELADGDAEHDNGDVDYTNGVLKYNSADIIGGQAYGKELDGDTLWAGGQFAAAKIKYDEGKTKYVVSKSQFEQAYALFSQAADHYNMAGAMWLTCWF